MTFLKNYLPSLISTNTTNGLLYVTFWSYNNNTQPYISTKLFSTNISSDEFILKEYCERYYGNGTEKNFNL